ncbi:hypothetical protein AbHV_ORF95 [Abalone herpesvirus Victoria/AUS/2009]|uniref:Uncharacterized protein n=1 Tax=Abalone herpesvirus (isolate Abalone/Australia/Victoria/2009) TaxID=1241371 RepID=K4K8M3_ABHV|nr:hypothetical protein AbHV_ORF95 [Abalone herpesvirus Victoria/AUS/2009]AFU90107.1 hypothetical protein AbHV_ORF95 [Abalone herpesvirus Victoria/AUS/2009]
METVIYKEDTKYKTLSGKDIAVQLHYDENTDVSYVVEKVKTKSDPRWKIILTYDLYLMISSTTDMEFINGTETIKEMYELQERPYNITYNHGNLIHACMKTSFTLTGFCASLILHTNYKERCLWNMLYTGKNAWPVQVVPDEQQDKRKKFNQDLLLIMSAHVWNPDLNDETFCISALNAVSLLSKIHFGDEGTEKKKKISFPKFTTPQAPRRAKEPKPWRCISL